MTLHPLQHVQTINQQIHANRFQGHDQIDRIIAAYRAVPQWIDQHTSRVIGTHILALDVAGLNGWTAIGIAARDNDCVLLQWAIANGANIELGCDGYTALHVAAYYGCYNAVAALLYNGADAHALTDSKHTPLQKAMRGQEKNARQGKDMFIGVQMYREVIEILTDVETALRLYA